MAQDRTLYIGFDESNHGRYPEIFSSVFSYNSHNALILPPAPKEIFLLKKRGTSTPIESLANEEDYSFFILYKK